MALAGSIKALNFCPASISINHHADVLGHVLLAQVPLKKL